MSFVIDSQKVDKIEELLPSFRFVFNANGVLENVSDKDLNSLEAAKGYSNRQFLISGNDVQTTVCKTFSRGLRMNDIIQILLPEYKIPIDMTKNLFIVRKVVTEYSGAKTFDTITGVRYD